MEERNLLTLLVGMEIGTATVEKIMEVSQKTKNRAAIRPSNSTPVYISQKTPKLSFEKLHASQYS